MPKSGNRRSWNKLAATLLLGASTLFNSYAQEAPVSDDNSRPSDTSKTIAVTDSVVENTPQIFASDQTWDRLPYAAEIKKYLAETAQENILIVTPQDLRDQSALDLDVVYPEEIDRALMVQALLKDTPGLGYDKETFSRDLSQIKGHDAVSEYFDFAKKLYNAIAMGNDFPQTMKNIVDNTTVIVMPDDPKSLEPFVRMTLAVDDDIAKDFTVSNPEEWYLLFLLHEATHAGQADYSSKDWAQGTYNMLNGETGADILAIEQYNRISKLAGLGLSEQTLEEFEDWRSIWTLNYNKYSYDQEDIGNSFFKAHATSGAYDIINGQTVPEGATTDYATLVDGMLYINTLGQTILAAEPLQKAITLPDESSDDYSKQEIIARYAVTRLLLEDGYLDAHPAAKEIATEYIDAVDRRLPKVKTHSMAETVARTINANKTALSQALDQSGADSLSQKYKDAIKQKVKLQPVPRSGTEVKASLGLNMSS